MNRLRFQHRIVSLFLAAAMVAVAGCGGGGDGAGGLATLTYTGNINPAVITAGNANQLAGTAIGANNAAGAIGIGAVDGQAAASPRLAAAIPGVTALVARALAYVPLEQSPAVGVVPPPPLPITIPGLTGTLVISGNIDIVTLQGNLRLTFTNFDDGSGEWVQGIVDIVVNDFDVINFILLDGVMTFTDFSYNGSAGDLTLQGTIAVLADVFTSIETATANLLARDNVSGLVGRVENYVVESVYAPDIFTPLSAAVTIAGRVYDPVLGYVDISTLAPLTFFVLDLYPSGGGPVQLTGEFATAGFAHIWITPVSPTQALIEVDEDGDGNPDSPGTTVLWDSL